MSVKYALPFACALLSSAAAHAADTDLVMNIFLPEQHFLYGELTGWAEKVNEVTQGRVAITTPAGSLAPPNQQYGAVTSGVADIAVAANIFIQRKEPLVTFTMLPWLISNAEDASIALWETYEEDLSDKGLYEDVELLSLFHFAGGQAYTTDATPINSLDDMRGRKMWALPGASTKLLVETGISPVTTPAVQISEPVSSGVVSGVFGLSIESARDFRIGTYVKTITEFPSWVSSISFSMVMNSDKWDQISETDQKAISAISGGVFAQQVGVAADLAYNEARAEFVEAGVTFLQADDQFYSELQEASAALFEDFGTVAKKRDADGAALIQSFQAKLDEVSKR
ncbi:MAG: TRAP transporter substrate-binding protein DctP [Sulfitobacter sp.]